MKTIIECNFLGIRMFDSKTDKDKHFYQMTVLADDNTFTAFIDEKLAFRLKDEGVKRLDTIDCYIDLKPESVRVDGNTKELWSIRIDDVRVSPYVDEPEAPSSKENKDEGKVKK